MKKTLIALMAMAVMTMGTACAKKSTVVISEKVVSTANETRSSEAVATPEPPDTRQWIDAHELTMEGRGWEETSSTYSRLPARAEALVTPNVWRLSHHGAGVSVRFVSDSPAIHANWSGGGAMPHMPATGVSGLGLHRRTA